MPVIVGLGSIRQKCLASVKAHSIYAVRNIAERAAVTAIAKTSGERSTTAAQQRALGIAGIFGDHVDHAVDGIGAPKGSARATDHLDSINVFEHYLLSIPKDPGKERRINRSSHQS